MLLVANISTNKKIEMSDDQKLFGIEKLNIKRSEIPAVTVLITQREYKQYLKKLIKLIMI